MKNKIALFILFLGCSMESAGQGQITLSKLDISNLPKEIKYEGKINNAVRWKDGSGDNIIITTETGPYSSKTEKDEDSKDAELFAYHFISEGDSIKLTWKIYDFIKACPLDIEANFIKNTLQVTDLNNDGSGEVWLMYKTACRSDVSPSDMKIIMYQKQQKFAMRGQNKVQVSEMEFSGGDYKFDKGFTEGPNEFRVFAKSMWDKNLMPAKGD